MGWVGLDWFVPRAAAPSSLIHRSQGWQPALACPPSHARSPGAARLRDAHRTPALRSALPSPPHTQVVTSALTVAIVAALAAAVAVTLAVTLAPVAVMAVALLTVLLLLQRGRGVEEEGRMEGGGRAVAGQTGYERPPVRSVQRQRPRPCPGPLCERT